MVPITADKPAAADESMDAWFTPGRFAALLALLIVACFPHVILGHQTFFYRDYALFGYPLAFHHREAFWNGEMPLWNPLNNCGLPFTAQWNTLTLYPLSLIYLLFPLPWSLGVFCLGHLFLAGLGMYFLAYRWTGNPLAAAVAGVAFAFNGLTWHSLMWPNNIAAFGWMPWVVLAVERAWREGGRRIVIAGLVGALQLLAGAPEVILQTWVLIGVLWLAQLFSREVPLVKMVIRTICAGGLAACLAAAQLLPFLDLLAHSQRDAAFADSQWSMPATGWANYLVALFRCFPAGRGVYTQLDQYWTSSYFLGVGVIALAIFAAWRARQLRVWVLAALALISLLMALGDHGFLYTGLKKLAPQIGFLRFPIKFVVLATFVLPILAAYGVAWLRTRPAETATREWRWLLRLGIVFVVGIILIVAVAWKYPLLGDDPDDPGRIDSLKTTVFSGLRGVLFLVLILGCIAVVQRKRRSNTQAVFQSVLIVLCWFDVFTHVPTLSPTVTLGVYQPGLMREYYNRNVPGWDTTLHAGQTRLMQTRASLQEMYWRSVEKPEDDVFGRRVTFFDDLNLLDRVPKFDGFYSLYLREMNAVLQKAYLTTNDLTALRDFLGVSHINPPTNHMEWFARGTASSLITAGQKPVFVDDTNALEILFDPAFDGRLHLCLPPSAKSEIQFTNRTEAKISSNEFSAHRIAFTVDAADPAVVSIAQAYYHPWRAYVDGKPVRLWRANYAFQGLQVPAGQHRVELVYRDRMFQAGALISLLTLLVCLALSVRRPPRK